MNRNFPGDKDSNKHEERIAAELLEQIKGMKTLDLHSTNSTDKIFAASSDIDQKKLEIARSSCASVLTYHENPEIGTINSFANATTVECGLQGSKQAKENAYSVLKNFLAAEGLIDEDYSRSDPELFEVYETVEKPEYDFVAENFEKVEKGDVYAKNGDTQLVAEKDFYPVLMSSTGYEDILGYKARKVSEDSS